jgi:hypothetical protein
MRVLVSALLVGGTAALALGGGAFRVTTAPERIRDRQELARKVCLERGGQWTQIDRGQGCRLPASSAPLSF